ncbi:MAG TPA: hypothetical protein VM097_01495 [Mycobacteriales bacterium]|nr:hypothetical protein [Mycobacteriales bacterium]
MSLRQLDERYLPRAAAWLRVRLDTVSTAVQRRRAAAAGWDLVSLDARFAGRKPLSLLRSQPVLALVVVGAVLAGGVGAALVQERDEPGGTGPRSANEPPGQGALPHGAVLGPQVGDRTRGYVRESTDGLVDAVRDAPGATRVALVSLSSYRTPEQADALLSGFTVRRAYLRAKAAGKEAAALPVEVAGPLLPALRRAYVETARSRTSAQRSYQGYVDTLRPNSTQDRAFRDLYAAFARSSGIEAREYTRNCACVYAVLVTASPVLLLSLNARPGVRAVEVAARGLSLLQVQVQPLLPEVEGVVPRPTFVGLS